MPATTTTKNAISQTGMTQPMPPTAWASTGVNGVSGVSAGRSVMTTSSKRLQIVNCRLQIENAIFDLHSALYDLQFSSAPELAVQLLPAKEQGRRPAVRAVVRVVGERPLREQVGDLLWRQP